MAAADEQSAVPYQEITDASIVGAKIIDLKVVDGKIIEGRIIGGTIVDAKNSRFKTNRVRRANTDHRHTEIVAAIGFGLALLLVYLIRF